MEAATGLGGGNCMSCSFVGIGFAFNNPLFSDRTLTIEVEPPDSKLGKRIRKEEEESEQPLLQRDSRSPSSTTLHINSLVLASKSPFFHKMFSNGMKESEQQAVTLSVHASEEQALLDLFQFLYSNKLTSNAPMDLLKVLILADKYQFVQCACYCVQMLSALPMTFELAVLLTNLSPSVLHVDSHLVQLVDAAKSFISKNFSSHVKDALQLPLESIKNILSWDTLEVGCEDEVCDFVLEWARTHYSDLGERRKAFSSWLFQLIRLPYLSNEKLKTLVECTDLDRGDATEMVVKALFAKAENHLPRVLDASSCPKRSYSIRLVKVTRLDSPYQQCVVYLELKKEELSMLAKITTEEFHVGNEGFHTELHRNLGNNTLGFRLVRASMRSTSDEVKVEWTIAARLVTKDEYVTLIAETNTYRAGESAEYSLRDSWDSFMAESSRYFIDDVFYLRYTLTIKQ